MRDIKIFVSHRIEFDSRTIDNPLFFNVRCGAVDDVRDNHPIQGDDTGDNISNRRISFGEFTVLYWAWKNIAAEYYGCLHYRRYFSFSPVIYKNTTHNQIFDTFLDNRAIRRYHLTDVQRMHDLIEANDAIVNKTFHVRGYDAVSGPAETVYDRWVSWNLLDEPSLDLLLEIIKEMYPAYLRSAQEFLFGSYHRGNNCFIFTRELFVRYCEFVFSVLFELEKRLPETGNQELSPRTPSFLGEIMYGIFIHHLQKQGTYSIKELQLVFFIEPRPTDETLRHEVKRAVQITENHIRRIRDTYLPLRPEQRMKFGRIYNAIKGLEISNIHRVGRNRKIN